MCNGVLTRGNSTTLESGNNATRTTSADMAPTLSPALTARAVAGTLRATMDAASRASLIRSLTGDAERISRQFGLRYKSIDAERANVTSRYGVCFSDGAIRIRLRHA